MEKSPLPQFKFALREDLKNNKEFLPLRATNLSSGWDVRAAQENRNPLVLRAGQYAKIPLGIRCLCPDGWWYELKPRSSTFTKKQLHCLYGTIDCDYEGYLVMAVQYLPDITSLGNDLVINFGDAIAQIIPVKLQEMEVLEVSNEELEALYTNRAGSRGTGGFGSTG